MIEVVGEERVVRTCAGISRRAGDLEPSLLEEATRLEASEGRLFDALGGRYVDTGALRDSLTLSGAPGAVREATASSLEFGSSIYYARYQVEDPGPVTEAGGLERRGHPSAVLKLEPADAAEAVKATGEYVMRGSEGFAL